MTTVHPIYLVKGDDAALLAQATSELVRSLVGEDGASLGAEELADDVAMADILDACLTPAFLASRRVVVVRAAGRFRGDDIDTIAKYLEAPMPSTSLVLVAGGGSLSPKLTKLVKSQGHVVDASAPVGQARRAWVTKRLAERQLRLTPRAIELFCERLGDEPAVLESVCDSLQSAYGEVGLETLGVDEIKPYIRDNAAAAPWDLTDAIDSGDTQAALVALRRMIGVGQRHPLQIMTSLTKHIANLATLDHADVQTEADVAKLLGVSPFPAKKLLRRSRALSSAALRRAQTLAAEADVDVRGASSWPPEYVLEVLIARLCKLSGV